MKDAKNASEAIAIGYNCQNWSWQHGRIVKIILDGHGHSGKLSKLFMIWLNLVMAAVCNSQTFLECHGHSEKSSNFP